MALQEKRVRRRRKIIKPGLQFRLIGTFLGVSALGFLLQGLVLALFLTDAATHMSLGGPYLQELIPTILGRTLLFSFGLLLPLTLAVGILVTFRIAGPVWRFETYLRQVIRGETTEPCRIRRRDELHELCGLINQATEPARSASPGRNAEATDQDRSAA